MDHTEDSPETPLLITMGDPCGIGPEIVAKAFLRGAASGCVVVGAVDALRGFGLPVARIDGPQAWREAPADCLPVWEPPELQRRLAPWPLGKVDASAGAAAAACITAGARAVMAGRGAALVTAPIHKEALSAAGVPYPGHTEMLQALAAQELGAEVPVRMMLANEQLRTVLVTIHLALRRAIDALDFDGVLQTLRITDRAMRAFGLVQPRIAVAGLNPHAGEGGLFGDEEVRFIAPAVAAARAEGIDARGPYAPDTVFMRARHDPPAHPGEFDVVVAMTHDHGLIPVKYLGVEQGVNVTLGLPFVRTSPDHGTAFDIAGKGTADPSSLIAAIGMARRLGASSQCRVAAASEAPRPRSSAS